MISTPRILTLMEERCVRIGQNLGNDGLDRADLADIETSLLLLGGALRRYLDESLRTYGGSGAALEARSAHNALDERLQLIGRYRADLDIGELQGFLQEVQGSALEAIRALREMPAAESPLVLTGSASA